MKKHLLLIMKTFLLFIVLLVFVSFETKPISNSNNNSDREASSSLSVAEKGVITDIEVSPNPFIDNLVLRYKLNKAGPVKIAIYNILGNKVITLANEYQDKGSKTFQWDALDSDNREVKKGVYIIRLQQNNEVKTKKVVKTR